MCPKLRLFVWLPLIQPNGSPSLIQPNGLPLPLLCRPIKVRWFCCVWQPRLRCGRQVSPRNGTLTARARTHTHTHTHTHTQAHTQTHTYTHTNTQTHKQTHTHMLAFAYPKLRMHPLHKHTHATSSVANTLIDCWVHFLFRAWVFALAQALKYAKGCSE